MLIPSVANVAESERPGLVTRSGERNVPTDAADDQRQSPNARGAGGHAALVGAARLARPHRHEVRLWHRAVRRVYRAHRRQAGALLHAPGERGGQSAGNDDRGYRCDACGGEGSESLARSGSGPVRLLPVRSDHVGRGPACSHAESRCRRHRCSHGRQHLPMWHLCSHPCRHQARSQRVRGQGGDMSVLQSAISRRRLLGGGLAGGFLLAFHLPTYGARESAQGGSKAKFAPNAFIRIDPAGKTTLVMPQVEMGQGVYTSVAMILAEELDADYQQVVLEHAPPNDKLYGNPVFGIQVTGNSNSIRAFWKPRREAGAAARPRRIKAAARTWKF